MMNKTIVKKAVATTLALSMSISILMSPWGSAGASQSYADAGSGGASQSSSDVGSGGASQSSAVTGNGGVTVKMSLGEPGFEYEGGKYDIPAPYLSEDVLFLPFVELAEVFGAEVRHEPEAEGGANELNQGGATALYQNGATALYQDSANNGTIIGRFHSNTMIIEPGSDEYLINNEKINLPGALQTTNGILYVMADLFDGFMNTVTLHDAETGGIIVFLSDDGNVTDLSELLGEVPTKRIGNSYFGWVMETPRKSIITSKSWNSDSVQIFNELRSVVIDVHVGNNTGMTYEEFQEELTPPGSRGFLTDISIEGFGAARYIEALSVTYDSVSITRAYLRPKYTYTVSITAIQGYGYESSHEIFDDPEYLKEAKDYMGILDSFEIRMFGMDEPGIFDISNIVDNKIKYKSVISIPESSKKVNCWSMDINPEWGITSSSVYNDIYTIMRDAVNEAGMEVVIYKPYDIEELENYFINYEEEETNNLNPELFNFIEGRNFLFNGYEALDIEFTLSYADTVELHYERSIRFKDIVCQIFLHMPIEQFEGDRESFLEMIDTFEFDISNLEAVDRNLSRQNTRRSRQRVSKDDEMAVVKNEYANWSSELPGYWIEEQAYYDSSEFSNPRNSAGIYVEALDGPLSSAKEYFLWMLEYDDGYDNGYGGEDSDEGDYEYIHKDVSIKINGKDAIRYTLLYDPGTRVTDVEYFDVYLVGDGEESYMITMMISYIFLSEQNKNELENFAQSFLCGNDRKE